MQVAQNPSNKAKFSLKMHLIFVVKYRKKLLVDGLEVNIKKLLLDACTKDFQIEVIETERDHVHMMVSYSPNVSVSQIVRLLKQKTTVDIWKYRSLKSYFWKEHTFWSNGYFVCSIGNASETTIRAYIENQG
jgi:putative transposase